MGLGTNRAVAQYQFDNGLTEKIKRKTLCYKCSWQNASARITVIPDIKLTVKTLASMADSGLNMIDSNQVMRGDFKVVLGYLNSVDNRDYFSCKHLLKQYGKLVRKAVKQT